MSSDARGPASRNLVLAAMIFAVAMMSVDSTIVAIAAPAIQHGLGLTNTGVQWVVNGYLLALAALFALGGKLGDVFGHRRLVIVGTVGFAAASALCGATPTGTLAETWLIVFRIAQGAFGALLFPAALAIVFDAFPARERGKALALFFGITGGLTSIGPIAGSFLLPWTWRAIFWINVPIAVVALVLTLRTRPDARREPARIDVTGAILVSAGMGLVVLGLQQASEWGWTSAATLGSLAAGVVLLVAFAVVELRETQPLIDLRIFASRGFTADNLVLALVCACFVPLFFFASVYAQVVLGYDAGKTGLYILVLFLGFATGSQVGGRILDRRGARRAVIPGAALAAVGFVVWADRLQHGLGQQWGGIVLAGAGLGLVLTTVSTDAINRAPRGSYGEVTGITQTVRYLASSLGLAVLGTVLIERTRSNITASLTAAGISHREAASVAAGFDTAGPPANQPHTAAFEHVLRLIQGDFAGATRTVFLAMAAVMAAASVIALLGMERGVPDSVAEPAGTTPRVLPET